MNDIIRYSDKIKCHVFDTPILEYRELMLEAAMDTQKLSENYKQCILKECLFVTLFTINDVPAAMYGLQPYEDDIARAFYRLYKHRQCPVTNFGDKEFRFTHDEWSWVTNFYGNYPHYHKALGINTLFLTRHAEHRQRGFSSLLKKWGVDYFIEHPEVKLYRKHPQRIFVWGDDNFLNTIPTIS